MRSISIPCVVAVGVGLLVWMQAGFVLGKELPVNLSRYTKDAEAIGVFTVERALPDGSIAVRTDRLLKGSLPAQTTLHGSTGHCVMRGPVSQFAKPGQQFLIFVFAGQKVGRLGGVLQIENGNEVVLAYVQGFKTQKTATSSGWPRLALSDAIDQIEMLLK